jgi:hypothetical protein
MTDIKSEVRTDIKTEVRTDIKTEVGTDIKTEVGTDIKTDVNVKTDTKVTDRTKKNKTKVRFAKDMNPPKEDKFRTEHVFIPNKRMGAKLNHEQLCSNDNHNHKHETESITKTTSMNTNINTSNNNSEDKKAETVFNMFNSFLKLYNTKHQTVGCIFENINLKDPQSTNDKLEIFYEYMQEHKLLEAENPSYIDVYDLSSTHASNDRSDNDIYALIVGDDDKIKYTSLSYISLLTLGSQDPKLTKKRWNIIKLT